MARKGTIVTPKTLTWYQSRPSPVSSCRRPKTLTSPPSQPPLAAAAAYISKPLPSLEATAAAHKDTPKKPLPPPPHTKIQSTHLQNQNLSATAAASSRRRRIDPTIYNNTISSLLSAASIYDNSIYIAKLFVITPGVRCLRSP
jgi:hypothetical protein